MAFQGFSKNYSDILMIPLFQHFCAIVSCLPCNLLFKFGRSAINIISRKINNVVIILDNNNNIIDFSANNINSTSLVHLYSNAINFSCFRKKYRYILLSYI